MKSRKEQVLALVTAREGIFSDHAIEDVDRLGLEWGDVIAVLETSTRHRSRRDERRQSRLKDSFVGRDKHGRQMYVTGKEITYEGEAYWYIITFHEARHE